MDTSKLILVTGGAGFVGSNLVKKLHEAGNKVYCVDNLSFGSRINYVEGVTYLETHTKDLTSLNIPTPDLIYHLGEYSKIAPSFDEIETVFDLNILGSFEVLQYARKNNIPVVYAASSTRLAPEGDGHSPYSFFKSTVTKLLRNYAKWYGLRYSICYFYNVYGEGQDTCDNGWETVISIFEKQYKAGKPLTVTGDGTQRRDFTYVGDIVDGLVKASEKLENQEYQLGSGEDFAIIDVAKMFSSQIEFIPERKGDRKFSKADTQDTYSRLGWKPSMQLTKWIEKVKQATPDVVIMTTAVDRPELHSQIFQGYKNYLSGTKVKWVITINSIQGREEETAANLLSILQGYDVEIKTFTTGGTRLDWYNSVKYCINRANEITPKYGYFWLEDDWAVEENTALMKDIQLLKHPKDYLCLVDRREVSFNPGVWGIELFKEQAHYSINSPEHSLGKRYFDGTNTNAERICCPFPETNTIVNSINKVPRFTDAGRAWQDKTIKVRTFKAKEL